MLTLAIVTGSNETVFISTLFGLKSVLPDTLLLIAVLGLLMLLYGCSLAVVLSGLGKQLQ